MAQKFFSTVFKIIEGNKTVLIRGEHIVKVEAFASERRVIFHLSDGSSHTFIAESADYILKLIEQDVF